MLHAVDPVPVPELKERRVSSATDCQVVTNEALQVLDAVKDPARRSSADDGARLNLYKNPRLTTFRQASDDDSQARKLAFTVTQSAKFEMFGGLLIMANFLIIVMETDCRARLRTGTSGTHEAIDVAMLQIIAVCNMIFSVFYTVEFGTRLFAQRMAFFQSTWNLCDMVTLTLDLLGEVVERSIGGEGVADMQLLRSMRMVRLVRLSRVVVSFPELYNLVCGLTRCVRTLAWAAGLILVTLTVWSIMAVEFVAPVVPNLITDGNYATCDWCSYAFKSVAYSNLTFFQIISGDGWSLIARPIIHESPWTSIIFVTIIFVVMFGLLNLVVASIVDASAQAREDDVLTLSLQTEADRQKIWDSFSKLCVELDADKSGDINKEEFREGLKRSPLLQAYLTVMGVQTQQIEAIFELLDENGDGEVSYHELSAQLYDMKTLHMKASMYYILKFVQDTRKKIQQHAKDTADMLSQLIEKQQKQFEQYLVNGQLDSGRRSANIKLDFVQLEKAHPLGLPAAVDDLEKCFHAAMMRLRCCTEQGDVAAEGHPIQAASPALRVVPGAPPLPNGSKVEAAHGCLETGHVKASPGNEDEDDLPPTPPDGYEPSDWPDQGRGAIVKKNVPFGTMIFDEDDDIEDDAVGQDSAAMPQLVRQESPVWTAGQDVSV